MLTCIEMEQIAEETELVVRLRHAPQLQSYGEEYFIIGRDDLRILMETRTEAANLFELLGAR